MNSQKRQERTRRKRRSSSSNPAFTGAMHMQASPLTRLPGSRTGSRTGSRGADPPGHRGPPRRRVRAAAGLPSGPPRVGSSPTTGRTRPGQIDRRETAVGPAVGEHAPFPVARHPCRLVGAGARGLRRISLSVSLPTSTGPRGRTTTSLRTAATFASRLAPPEARCMRSRRKGVTAWPRTSWVVAASSASTSRRSCHSGSSCSPRGTGRPALQCPTLQRPARWTVSGPNAGMLTAM